MSQDIKKYAVYFNLALFCMVIWYFIAELLLTLVWKALWH